MTPTSHITDDPAEGDVLAYAASSLDELRGHLERAQSTATTALVIVRLAIMRRSDQDSGGDQHPDDM